MSAGFEQSPFKLTPEFVDVIGGLDSELWRDFEYLLLKGVMAARKHMDRIINVVEIMRSSKYYSDFILSQRVGIFTTALFAINAVLAW